MTYYADETVTLYQGDAATVLATLPDKSVNCCVTSPPYFALRDYGVSGQIGAEPSPAEYVAALVAVFDQLRRVLADDGVFWLNVGDSYAGVTPGRNDAGRDIGGRGGNKAGSGNPGRQSFRRDGATTTAPRAGSKNLLGIPWRLAFALQDAGWVLRNAAIWHKPNAMPESVTDRLSNRYEHLFLFSKSRKYWFDLDAIREDYSERVQERQQYAGRDIAPNGYSEAAGRYDGNPARGILGFGHRGVNPSGRNPGDVWSIPTAPFPGAHFAAFPPELPRRCILAGCKPRKCNECGHMPERTTGERRLDTSRPQARRALELAEQHGLTDAHIDAIRSAGVTDAGKAMVTQSGTGKNSADVQRLAAEAKTALGGYFREFLLGRAETTGWTDCGHNAYRPGVVLDPFHGSGTTGMVAQKLGRRYVGIDLNAEYLDLSLRTRLNNAALPFEMDTA